MKNVLFSNDEVFTARDLGRFSVFGSEFQNFIGQFFQLCDEETVHIISVWVESSGEF